MSANDQAALADPVMRRGDQAPVALASDDFRRLGHTLVDSIAGFLDGVRDGPVTRVAPTEAVHALIDAFAPLPEEGADPDTLLASTAELLYRHSLLNGHPRFFGYITSSPAPIGMLGDLLAAGINANVGAWQLSPLATEIEAQTVRWIADFVGYPRDCGGLLVSGGNMANMVGLFAARVAAADWNVRADGVGAPGAAGLRVYASAETHTWLQKATDLAGLGTNAIRWIATGDDLRMDVGALRRALDEDRAAGLRAMMVVATAGSVSTGAVDPIGEIATLCREFKVWLHVDGAYGALAARVPGVSPDLTHLAQADSVAVDPHKWLYAPIEAGCALVRDRRVLRQAFAYHPPYYHFGQEATNYLDFGPQNTRGFRALKVWLALRQAGRQGYVDTIGDDIRLSQRMHDRISEHPELEPFTQALSISTFRFVPSELRALVGEPATEEYLNRVNEMLLDRLQTSGELFVSNAVIRGTFVLRACIVNFNTTEADVAAVPDIVVRHGRELHAAMRLEVPGTATTSVPD
jgi:glutamate/tyrosine decarboxylase-like PLP-dependent enzyme